MGTNSTDTNVILNQQNKISMIQKISAFFTLLMKDLETATPEEKKAILESAKIVVTFTMSGDTAKFVTTILSEIEATIH